MNKSLPFFILCRYNLCTKKALIIHFCLQIKCSESGLLVVISLGLGDLGYGHSGRLPPRFASSPTVSYTIICLMLPITHFYCPLAGEGSQGYREHADASVTFHEGFPVGAVLAWPTPPGMSDTLSRSVHIWHKVLSRPMSRWDRCCVSPDTHRAREGHRLLPTA